MSHLRVRRRFAAWLAILAMLLGALAPTITQARMAGGDRADWLEVCSASGMVWVKADTGETAKKPGSGTPASDRSQHCPWCTLHSGAVALPSAVVMLDLPPRLTDLPPAFYRTPLAETIWLPAHSRAPPLAA